MDLKGCVLESSMFWSSRVQEERTRTRRNEGQSVDLYIEMIQRKCFVKGEKKSRLTHILLNRFIATALQMP